MSDGAKVALILGAAGIGAFLIFRNNASAGAGAAGPVGLGTSPGAPLPNSGGVVGAVALAPQPAAAPQGGSSLPSIGGIASGLGSVVGKLATAPVIIPTTIAVAAAKSIAGGAVSTAKTIGSGLSSIGHSIASIF